MVAILSALSLPLAVTKSLRSGSCGGREPTADSDCQFVNVIAYTAPEMKRWPSSSVISEKLSLYTGIEFSSPSPSVIPMIDYSVPARLGKGQHAKEIGHNLARERPKFGHNLVRKRHKIGHTFTRERPKFCLVCD